MGDIVMGILGLVSNGAHWVIANAFPIIVGAVLGGPLGGVALGLVSDVLGRASEGLGAVKSVISGK